MKNIFAVLLLSLLCSCASTQKLEPINNIPPGTKSVTAITPVYSQKISIKLPNSKWKTSFENQTKGTYRIEFRENTGLKKDDWQELISIQGLKNMTQISPQTFLEGLAVRYQKSCPNNFKYKPMGPVNISTHSGASAVMGCSQNPRTSSDNGSNRKGELGYYFSIQGTNDLYLIHKAYRGQSTEINKLLNEEFAKKFIADILPIKICKRAGHEAECIE